MDSSPAPSLSNTLLSPYSCLCGVGTPSFTDHSPSYTYIHTHTHRERETDRQTWRQARSWCLGNIPPDITALLSIKGQHSAGPNCHVEVDTKKQRNKTNLWPPEAYSSPATLSSQTPCSSSCHGLQRAPSLFISLYRPAGTSSLSSSELKHQIQNSFSLGLAHWAALAVNSDLITWKTARLKMGYHGCSG